MLPKQGVSTSNPSTGRPATAISLHVPFGAATAAVGGASAVLTSPTVGTDRGARSTLRRAVVAGPGHFAGEVNSEMPK